VLQFVAVRGSVMHYVAVCHVQLGRDSLVYCSVLHRVVECNIVLFCVAVYCSMLQYVTNFGQA